MTPYSFFIIATAFEYTRFFPQENDAIVLMVRKALYSRNNNKIEFGFIAVRRFIEAYDLDNNEVPPILISAVITICESLREQGLYHSVSVVVELVKTGVVNDDELLRLSDTAAIIWSEFTYDSKKFDQKSEVTWTLVRSKCVKLAKALQETGLSTDATRKIIEDAVNDPIPEVRFA